MHDTVTTSLEKSENVIPSREEWKPCLNTHGRIMFWPEALTDYMLQLSPQESSHFIDFLRCLLTGLQKVHYFVAYEQKKIQKLKFKSMSLIFATFCQHILTVASKSQTLGSTQGSP